MESGFDSNGTFYLINKKEDVPIVFIHGVGLNHSIWDNQIREFENTVLVYDILGHGKTPLNLNTISFDDFTNQLINLLNHLEIDKIHLVGFSIGSLIARNFATKYCDKLKSLTLFGSIFNDLWNASIEIYPKLHTIKQSLEKKYQKNFSMSGSGSALFSIFEELIFSLLRGCFLIQVFEMNLANSEILSSKMYFIIS